MKLLFILFIFLISSCTSIHNSHTLVTNIKESNNISEFKNPGGEVGLIKIKNKGWPDYYLYPQREQQNSPSSTDISPPIWRFNW